MGFVSKLNEGKETESRYFYLFYYRDGKQIRESSKSESKLVAERLLNKKVGQVAAGVAEDPNAKRLTYEMVREDLLTYYRNKKFKSLQTLADGKQTIWGLSHIDSFFGGRKVASIKTDDLHKFVSHRQKEDADNGTINRNLSLLRTMLNLAKDNKKISGDSLPSFKRVFLTENDPRDGFLEHADFERLLYNLPGHVRPLIRFLYCTGCRLGAAQSITWRQVNLKDGIVRLLWAQTKNGELLHLPLPAELLALLKTEAKGKNPDDAVFYQGAFRKTWVSACIKCGFGHREAPDPVTKNRKYVGLIVHDLRRSAVRNLINAGVSQSRAKKISGHKTDSVFQRYNITDDKDIKNAMELVQAQRTQALEAQRAKILQAAHETAEPLQLVAAD